MRLSPLLLLPAILACAATEAERTPRPRVERPPKATSAEPTTTPEPSPITLQINIPARELRIYEQGTLQQTYPVAIGQPKYASITMTDVINRIEWNPWWYPPDSEWAEGEPVTPPGPKNPLGSVKLPLGRGIRIHGTNNERSVGRPASHGCFRMRNADATALAWLLQSRFSEKTDPALPAYYAKHRTKTFIVSLFVDVPINVIYEPIEVRDGTLYLYPDVYGRVGHWPDRVRERLTTAGYNSAAIPPEQLTQWRAQLRKGKVVVPLQ